MLQEADQGSIGEIARQMPYGAMTSARMCANGKKPIVAIMRKIVVILNAIIKGNFFPQIIVDNLLIG